MSLRFFADHCISNVVIQMLRDAGHEVFRLRDYIPKDSADSVVILKAQELDSILISLNGDFSDIVTYPPANYKGVIALQMRNHPEIITQLMTRLKDYLSAHPDMDYYKGKLLLAVLNLEFIEDMFEVGFKGITAHGKRFRDGIILMTGDYQVEDLLFPVGQVDSRMNGANQPLSIAIGGTFFASLPSLALSKAKNASTALSRIR